MKRFLTVLLLALPALVAAQTTSPGMTEVRELGLLNGEALACGQMALVDRIRIAVVYGAPKTREIGETFEAATSERFLALGQNKGACGDGKDLSARVEAAMQAMQTIFGKPAQR